MKDPRYTYRMVTLITLLVAAIIFVATFATCAHAEDVTYTSQTDPNGQVRTQGSDGSRYRSQTDARGDVHTDGTDGNGNPVKAVTRTDARGTKTTTVQK